MKATYEDINSKKGADSFLVYNRIVPSFDFKWHYHPEFELTLIVKGSGKRLVGDNYTDFGPGDLVLVGPGLPHTWASDQSKIDNSWAVVIQFPEEFINRFLKYPEFTQIARLMNEAQSGLVFHKIKTSQIAEEIIQLPQKEGVEKITALVNILHKLSLHEPDKLVSPFFNSVKGLKNEKRINTVCHFIQEKANGKISLQETANQVHLSSAAFCKFFKRATGKTFSDYVNDVRIGNACMMLTESDKPISEIAYHCGYDSITYFNRVFLKKKRVSPRHFRGSVLSY